MSGATALAIIREEIYGVRSDFDAVLCDRSINFEREVGFAMQVLTGNEYLAKIALQARHSLRAAVTNTAAIGLSLNPAKKQTYLLPRKVNGQMIVCLDISYIGLLALAVSSGSILWGQAELVRATDVFKRRGFDQPPLHEFEEFSTTRGEIVGVYVVVKLPCGDFLTTTMTTAEVNDIRDRSEAWKAFKDPTKNVKSCPWSTDFGEMAKKTVIKRASKLWPNNERLSLAVHHLNTAAGEGLDDIATGTTSVEPPAPPQPEANLLDAARAAAMRGMAELRKYWETTLTEEQRLTLKRDLRSLRAAAAKADEDRTIDSGATQ